jgi:hypothetical protein
VEPGKSAADRTHEEETLLGLRPAVLHEYEEHVGQLQAVFDQGVTPDYEEASTKIRSLMACVTLRPSGEGFKIAWHNSQWNGHEQDDGIFSLLAPIRALISEISSVAHVVARAVTSLLHKTGID